MTLVPLLALTALVGLASTEARANPSAPPHAPGAYPSRVSTGQVIVQNRSGGPVRLSLGAREARTVEAGEDATFHAPAGITTVSASYEQFGDTRVLENETVRVLPRQASVVVIEPETTARILVTNATRRTAQLYIDGVPSGVFSPGETQLVSTVVGEASLWMTSDGRDLDRAQITLRPFAEQTWTAEVPAIANVTVVNPLPIPVTLTCARGLVRTVAPGASAVYANVPFGTFHLIARRTTGELVDQQVISVGREDANRWRIDPPTTGLVVVDSDDDRTTRVLVDGELAATLSPDAQKRLALSVGWHQVSMIDPTGRTLGDTWVEVTPYEIGQLAFGHPSPRHTTTLTRPDPAAVAYEAGDGCHMP
jgi:hypothetical protein